MEKRFRPRKIIFAFNSFLKAVKAIEKGELLRLKELIEKHPDILNEKNKSYYGYTLLHYAVYYSIMQEKYDIVSYLVKDTHINVDEHELKHGKTALHIAALFCDVNLLPLLVEGGIDINVKDYEGSTPLFYSISWFIDNIIRFKFIQHLLEYGADLNALDNYYSTPLCVSIFYNQYETMRFLVEKGAIVDHSLLKGSYSPLVNWLPSMDNDDLEFLLKHGARVDIPCILDDKDNIFTPLHIVVEYGSLIDKAKLLLDYGADPLFKDSKGKTPLDLAIEKNDEEMVELLKKYIKE